MNLRQRIEKLRDDVRTLADDTGKTVDPLRLSAELDRILSQSDWFRDHLFRKYDRRMELWKEARLEMTRAVISFGQGAIRSLILINGGAAVAIMTFLGNFGGESNQSADLFAKSLLLFALGVAAAALVGGFAYVTQFLYESSSGRLSKVGIGFHWAAVLLAILSITLFVVGLLKAYYGFSTSS